MKSYKDHDLHSTVQSFTTLTSFFEEKTLVMRKRNKNGLISIRTIIQRIHTTTCPDKNKQLSLHSKQITTDSAVIYSIDLELVILTSAPMMKKVGLQSMYYKIVQDIKPQEVPFGQCRRRWPTNSMEIWMISNVLLPSSHRGIESDCLMTITKNCYTHLNSGMQQLGL